jgi:RNA polymerase sigma factor (sigma-70 family)
MSTLDTHQILNAYSQKLIQIKARQLCRRREFGPQEREDIEQELTLRLLQRAHHFDPARGSIKTFAVRVVDSCIRTLFRERARAKRNAGQRPASLEQRIPGSEQATTLADLLSPCDLNRRHGSVPPITRLERQDRLDAIRSAADGLPLELREICVRLMGCTPTRIARELGVSRHRIAEAIRMIRDHFQAAGLDEFMH